MLKQTNLSFVKLCILPAVLIGGLFLFNACSDDDDVTSNLSPSITGFSPERGEVGATVTITGKNFSTSASKNTVAFNDITAEVQEATATTLKVVVPDEATTGKITVGTNGQTATSQNDFTMLPASFLLTAALQTESRNRLYVLASVQDIAGNTYVAGYFIGGWLTLGNNTLKATTNNTAFVGMYNEEDGFVWGGQVESAGISVASSLAVDESGNVYVAGHFKGTAQVGETTLSSEGVYDAFVARYDASGQAVWARQAGGEGDDRASGVIVTPAGNIMVTGLSSSTEAVFGDLATTTSSAPMEGFLATCDSDGNFTDVSWLNGTGIVTGNHLAIDAAGDVYVAGAFSGTMTVGSFELTSNGSFDIFVAKYSGTGNVSWAANAGSSSNDGPVSMVVDASGSVYVASNSNFIEKFDASGGSVWKNHIGLVDDLVFSDLALDETGSLFLTGGFWGDMTFGTTALSSFGSSDVFLARQDISTGEFTWADHAGGIEEDKAGAINVSPSGSVYVHGQFIGAATFGEYTSSTSGTYAIFSWKFRP